jgi:predicted nucleic acid-binding Zn ribbon protein
MPIFVYVPADENSEYADHPERECCYFETLQWSNEAPLSVCPDCGQPIRRALAGFALAAKRSADPLRNAVQRLDSAMEEGISSGSQENAASGSSGYIGSGSDSSAKRAARLAYRHVCSGTCRH